MNHNFNGFQTDNDNDEIKALIYFYITGGQLHNSARTVSEYLGIQVQHNIEKGLIILDQSTYLKQILKRYGMPDCNLVHTYLHIIILIMLSNEDLVKLCRKIIGSLLYTVSGTQPDLCASVNFLSRFQDKGSKNLLKSIKQILPYVQGTVNLKLFFELDDSVDLLSGFVDVNWGGDVCNCKSTSGYIFKLSYSLEQQSY